MYRVNNNGNQTEFNTEKEAMAFRAKLILKTSAQFINDEKIYSSFYSFMQGLTGYEYALSLYDKSKSKIFYPKYSEQELTELKKKLDGMVDKISIES